MSDFSNRSISIAVNGYSYDVPCNKCRCSPRLSTCPILFVLYINEPFSFTSTFIQSYVDLIVNLGNKNDIISILLMIVYISKILSKRLYFQNDLIWNKLIASIILLVAKKSINLYTLYNPQIRLSLECCSHIWSENSKCLLLYFEESNPTYQ